VEIDLKPSPTKRPPSAQIEPAKKAAALKAANEPARLLRKTEVCALANATYPSIWAWMRAGTFPRARIVGGRSMWRSDEVAAWMAALPVRRLKGDQPEEAA
jgi:predicted DNA-binding transcriptional regulator AlpA